MSTALHYPYIEVEENWLKTSLLYWDRIRRIFPKEAQWEILSPAQLN